LSCQAEMRPRSHRHHEAGCKSPTSHLKLQPAKHLRAAVAAPIGVLALSVTSSLNSRCSKPFSMTFRTLLALSSTALAGTPTTAPIAHDHIHCSNIPAGVMFAHQMDAGSWMFGSRYMFQNSSGMLQGSDKISPAQHFATEAFPGSNYHAAPVEMAMHMTMFEAMWAPTDSVTLMVMTQYNSMSMTMLHGGSETGGGHGGHGGSSHSPGSTHEHVVSGWGDTNLTAAIRLLEDEVHHLHLTLGFSAPTGSVSKRGEDGRFTHYMMQPGSGTWDSITGLTYTGQKGRVFWGAQYINQLRLEDEGASGFRVGDLHTTTAWLGTELNDWASFTTRLNWSHQGQMRGHYNGPHNHASPVDFTKNYGGDVLELGAGLSAALGGRARVSIEALWPIYQDVVGIQPRRDYTINVGLQVSF
jgi:hypothetical protein